VGCLAVLSDDGVRVTIDGNIVLDKFNNLQHLPDYYISDEEKKSLRTIPYVFEYGKKYYIKIEYRNQDYRGGGDVDGIKLFGYMMGICLAG
jgi:hypothetical protein